MFSVQWGEWGGSGMAGAAAAGNDAHAQARRAAGISSISPRMGMVALGAILRASGADAAQVAVLPFEWARFVTTFRRSPHFFSHVVEEEAVSGGRPGSTARPHVGADSGARDTSELTEEICGILRFSGDERKQQLESLLLEQINHVVGSVIDRNMPLMDAGLDSLSVVETTRNVSAKLGMELPATMVFDYPSVCSMAGYLSVEVGLDIDDDGGAEPAGGWADGGREVTFATGYGDGGNVGVAAVASRWPHKETDVDCIGLTDADALAPIAPKRWDAEWWSQTNGDVGARFACFVREVQQADGALFGCSSTELIAMDAQHRTLLDVVHELLTFGVGAGTLTGKALLTKDAAVMVGIQQMEYATLLSQNGVRMSPYTATGGTLSVAAGRVSYAYGFQGPCASVDTACSSSMVGCHFARQSFALGACHSAVSCGVQLMLSSGGTGAVYTASMLTPLQDIGRHR